MGMKLVELYEKANKMGGLKAKMRLAILTKIPSTSAPTVPDTQEAVKAFENAIRELEKEFK